MVFIDIPAVSARLLVMGGVGELRLVLDSEIGEFAVARVAEEQGFAPVGDQDDTVIGKLHRALHRWLPGENETAARDGCRPRGEPP